MCTFEPSGYISKFDFPKLLKSQNRVFGCSQNFSNACNHHGCSGTRRSESHRVDQVGEDPLWKRLPLSLQHLEQMLGIPGRGVVAPDFAIQLIPEVLNRVEIETACWPLHSVDARLLQEVVDHPCSVGASVVILVDSHRSYLLQCRHSQRSKDLVPVSEAIQVTLYMIQGCSVVQAEGPPDHYRTSPKGHLFLDSGISKALPRAPPDPQSAVVVVHGEA